MTYSETSSQKSPASLEQLLKEFLVRRGISKPDGRPLCIYRSSDEEFSALIDVLAVRSGDVARFDSESSALAACFCLFASEWWRRNYSGGHWKWQDLLEDIDFSGVFNRDLYRLVELGLRFWNRPLLTTGQGRGFLVTLACEGGLPLQLIRQEGTRLRTYFRALLEEFQIYREAALQPERLAEHVADRLPRTLRQDVVFRVSGALVDQIWDLQAKVGASEDPIGTLNQVDPDWRERLPLRIEDETAEALLLNLVEEASRLVSIVPTRISVNRNLRETLGGWVLAAEIDLPGVTPSRDLAALLGSDEDGLNSRLELYAVDDADTSTLIGLASQRIRNGQPEFLLEKPGRKPLRWQGETAAHSLRVVAAWGSFRLPPCPLPNGEALSNLPWTFVVFKASESLRLIGQGSVRARHPEVIIAADPSDQPHPEDGSTCEYIGPLIEPEKMLYRVCGCVRFVDAEGTSCVVRTGQREEFTPRYRMDGKLAPARSDAGVTYAGIPKLYRYEETGRIRAVDNKELQWRPAGSGPWLSGTVSGYGLVELRHIVDGELNFRNRFGVVPKGILISFRHGATHREGDIELCGVPDADIGWHDYPDVDISLTHSHVSGDRVTILHCISTDEPPAELGIVFKWGDGTGVQLRTPYPARGGRFVARGDSVLANFAAVSFQSLSGLCAVATSTRKADTFILNGNLIAHDISPRLNRSVAVWEELPFDGANGRRLELSYLEDQLSQLFGATSDLDACINLRLQGPTSGVRQIEVRRFDLQLRPNRDKSVVELLIVPESSIPPEYLGRLRIEALPLWDPSREPVALERLGGMNPESPLAWNVDESLMDSGPWLIVGWEGSWCRLRPLLWQVKKHASSLNGADSASNDLRQAVCISDPALRHEVMELILARLADNAEDANWETFTAYFSAFRGLPSATFDLFGQVTDHPQTAAAALLRADQNQFDAIWERLDELPFSWHLVPISAWLQSADRMASVYRRQLADLDMDIEGFVRQAFATFADRAPLRLQAMELIVELIDAVGVVPGLSGTGGTISLARVPAGRVHLRQRIAEARQDLLRAQADTEWPQGHHINNWADQNPNVAGEFKELRLQVTEGAGFRSDVLNAPVVAALTSTADVAISRELTCEIKRLRRFDERWFDTAYSITLALAIGKMLDGAKE